MCAGAGGAAGGTCGAPQRLVPQLTQRARSRAPPNSTRSPQRRPRKHASRRARARAECAAQDGCISGRVYQARLRVPTTTEPARDAPSPPQAPSPNPQRPSLTRGTHLECFFTRGGVLSFRSENIDGVTPASQRSAQFISRGDYSQGPGPDAMAMCRRRQERCNRQARLQCNAPPPTLCLRLLVHCQCR